ncbi:MAG: hypothetical protein OSB57_04130 [Planctomycetota bacterium]|nr:hypothetical protein [Planctomycetota bacterium]
MAKRIKIHGSTRGRTELIFEQEDIDVLAAAVLISIRAQGAMLPIVAESSSTPTPESDGPVRQAWNRLTRRMSRRG